MDQFLTNRWQRDFVNGYFSELSLTCTGPPQGCVLSPLLYVLYIYDSRSNHLNGFLVEFVDDSALLSLPQGYEQYHGPALIEFVDWCHNSYLDLNVTKTKAHWHHFCRQAKMGRQHWRNCKEGATSAVSLAKAKLSLFWSKDFNSFFFTNPLLRVFCHFLSPAGFTAWEGRTGTACKELSVSPPR